MSHHPSGSADPSVGSAGESHTAFFKQGGWLVVATGVSGVFMMGTQIVAQTWVDPAEPILFLALLRVYQMFGIPSIGLQSVFAHQAASAVTLQERENLVASVRAVLRAGLVLWVVAVLGAIAGQSFWLEHFKIRNPGALWATLGIGLACLWGPVLRGVVQGRQRFFALGSAVIMDGTCRFSFVLLFTWLGGQAASGMSGALLGQVFSLALCAWVVRDVFSGAAGRFAWGPWLRHVVPLTVGLGTLLVFTTADVIFVHAVCTKEQERFYVPASLVGVALMTFTMPVAAVMFPKVARSVAMKGRSRAMPLALAATAGVGALGAVACTLFPQLPLRLIFFSKPEYWVASPMVPWFAWALVPLMVSVVLINNLLAQSRFRVVPWVAGVGVLYLGSLFALRGYLVGADDPLQGFRMLLGVSGGCSTLLLVLAMVFTAREGVPAGAGAPSV